MDLELSGKLALVTGASKGIGRAIAIALAEEGCNLALVSRDVASLNRVAEAINDRFSRSVRVLPADLSKQNQIERLASEFSDLDILVNNAGAIPPGNLLAVDNTAWRAAWDLKVFGYISMCRALYPSLQKRKGIIINIIGSAGERLDPNYIAGSTGNAALMAFTKSLAKGAAKEGMRVIGINPGPVATDRLQTMMRGRAKTQFGDESRWQELLTTMSFGRAAAPEEIASAVAFLAPPIPPAPSSPSTAPPADRCHLNPIGPRTPPLNPTSSCSGAFPGNANLTIRSCKLAAHLESRHSERSVPRFCFCAKRRDVQSRNLS